MPDISKIQLENAVYNIKDETARNSINTINQEITNLTNERILCIGDSYGVGTTSGGTIEGWCDRLKELRGLSDSNFIKLVEGSNGFSRAGLQGHTFQSLLEANINNISNPETVTKIVVCGGHNEYQSNAETLNSTIQSFINYCKQHFVNAKIYIGMVGNNSNNTAFGIEVRNAIYDFILRSYQNCVRYGGIYLSGIENIMHDYYDFMSDDGIHPSNLGYTFLASYINQALNNGYCDFIGNRHTETFQADNSDSTFQISSHISNDVQTFYNNNDINIQYSNPINWSRGSHLTLSNKTPKNFAFHNRYLKIPIMYYVVTSDSKFYGGQGFLEFRENMITIRNALMDSINHSGYFDINNIQQLVVQPASITSEIGIC